MEPRRNPPGRRPRIERKPLHSRHFTSQRFGVSPHPWRTVVMMGLIVRALNSPQGFRTMNESRRRALQWITAAATVRLSNQSTAQSSVLAPTPRDTEGPFYPVDWTGEVDGDLISVGGKHYSQGTSLLLLGRVLGVNGLPIVGARVEIWQVDATGRYRHPNDDGERPLKRGFQGFGRVLTDPQGAYRFRTIKPIAYQSRPAHIHFRVAAKGYKELTTQMYFAGENKEGSSWGGFSKERDRLTVTTTPIRDEASAEAKLTATFDIVLATV
ncbi:MAG: hypothetical protein EAZ30_10420 [Betaproteobacteria bacterium]|nr:MAG: hypothetical protein EAZ30_10420 [Betaproteobacteria bacterium]